MTPPFRRAGPDLLVAVKVTPKAASDAVDGIRAGPDGTSVLAIRVRAAPEGGRANAAVEALLAAALRLPKSAVAVVSGAGSRTKRVAVRGGADLSDADLAAAFAGRPDAGKT